MPKKQLKPKKPVNYKLLSEFNKNLGGGRGLTIAIGSKNVGEKERVEFYYSSKVPKLISKQRPLEIEYSSVENENKELLHDLLEKTRKEKN